MIDRIDKYRDMEPTIIQAQPGFLLARMSYDGASPISKNTEIEDINVSYQPIIAWIVRTQIREGGDLSEIYNADVDAVTIAGVDDGNDTYIVSPVGSWHQVNGIILKNIYEAKEHYIASCINT